MQLASVLCSAFGGYVVIKLFSLCVEATWKPKPVTNPAYGEDRSWHDESSNRLADLASIKAGCSADAGAIQRKLKAYVHTCLTIYRVELKRLELATEQAVAEAKETSRIDHLKRLSAYQQN